MNDLDDTQDSEARDRSTGIDRRGLAFGIAMLLAGLLLVLSHFQVLPPINAGQLWPLFLVGFGIAKLLAPKRGGRRWGGAVMTLLGTWLLLDSIQLWKVPLDVAWSGALAIGGLFIVIDALHGVFAARRRSS